MKMKKLYKYIIIVFLIILVGSCDEGFDEMNISPIDLTTVEPSYQLNYVLYECSDILLQTYEGAIVKQYFRLFSGVGGGGNYNVDERGSTAGVWNQYNPIIRNLVDIINKVKDDPARTNLYNQARIMKAYVFMVLTDTYGEIPYSEWGLGYLEGITKPKYETQQAIYTDILNELEEASAALDPDGKVFPDVAYAGDIEQWKKLGYSLLLRAGMRLSKVDPDMAESIVQTAVAGGVMESNEDSYMIKHTAEFPNDAGSLMNGGQPNFYYIAEDIVDHLKSTNDPRLTRIAVRYVGATSAAQQTESRADRTAEAQIGAPLGYDNVTISEVYGELGISNFNALSQLDKTKVAQISAPTFIVTYGQTQLLLAEAAYREWITGDPAALYEEAIRAHMGQFAEYGANCVISEAEINDYIAAHPLDLNNALEEINTQYWVVSFLNGHETWANFRRSGYPDLEPNPFPGNDLSTEDFIRRMTYLDDEYVLNNANLMEAIGRQGPDILDTRVWWDVDE